MGVFFGTDGLRGKTNDDLSAGVAYKCGNSLASSQPNLKIIIGTDTRKSKDLFALSFSCGAINAGADVTYVGVCPTAAISYLVLTENFDYGVVITASHNPAEFNGIKIFDKTGKKITDKFETIIEKQLLHEKIMPFNKIGSYHEDLKLTKKYIQFLKRIIGENLFKKKIVFDLANGSATKVARKIFSSTNSYFVGNKPNGLNINLDCGALCIENLIKHVKAKKADVGFAFDGDSDRLIAVDEKGNIVDGDQIVYIFARFFKKKNFLGNPCVVGTRHTNMGIQESLEKEGIKLIRTEIGDKYVSAKLDEQNLLIGGEQSGHVFVKNLLPTGDGILNAILLLKIMSETGKNLSELACLNKYKQCNRNVKVTDKLRVINSEKLSAVIEDIENNLGKDGRLMVRISGTEPCVRIMVESKDLCTSEKFASKLESVVISIDKEFSICVE